MSKRHPAPTLPPKQSIRDVTFHMRDIKTGVWTIIPHNEKALLWLLNHVCQYFPITMRDDGTEGDIDHVLIGKVFASTPAFGVNVTSKVDLT